MTTTRRSLLGMSSLAFLPEYGRAADTAWMSIEEASRLLRKKSISPVELTRGCLGRIERLNSVLNAYITVTKERAVAQANAAERELRRGNWLGPLHGIPIALKDNIDTAGVRTTAASAIYADRIPAEDSDVVRRLLAAGAVIIGKTNLDEFAFGHSGRLSHFGAVQNPWRLGTITGGSSGGSAAAVAAGLCFGAFGTDTSSSVRLPAAYCGIVGLRPSPGLISTRGVIPTAPSLDEVGPMCRSVRDCSILFSVVAGVAPSPVNQKKLVRVGVPRTFYDRLNPEVEKTVGNALDGLRRLGWPLRDIDLPGLNMAGAEAMAGIPLSGIWASVVGAEAISFHQPLLDKTPQLYRPEISARIAGGAKIGRDAYEHARQQLAQLRQAVDAVFVSVDIVVTPTSPVPACAIDTEPSLDAMRNTMPLSVYGLPTISIPCGFTSDGMPVGLQITGPRRGEAFLFGAAATYEQATEWHRHRPNLG